MGSHMQRRRVLAGVGNAVVGLALTAGAVGARPDGDKPAPMVPSESVAPGPFGPQTVSTGEWVEYEFYWIYPADDVPGGCDRITEEVKEVREWKVKLADRTLDYGEAGDHWGDCRTFDFGPAGEFLGKRWSYTTGPLPPGEYEIYSEVRFTEDTVYCGRGTCESFREGDVRHLSNTLVVEGGGGAEGRGR